MAVFFRAAEVRMYRVLVALILTLLAVQLSGCTGSLRLGSSIPVVDNWLANTRV